MVLASMPAVRLLFRARVVIKYFLRQKELYKIQRSTNKHFLKFSLAGISHLLKGNVVLRKVIWLTPPEQEHHHNRSSTNLGSLRPIVLCLMQIASYSFT